MPDELVVISLLSIVLRFLTTFHALSIRIWFIQVESIYRSTRLHRGQRYFQSLSYGTRQVDALQHAISIDIRVEVDYGRSDHKDRIRNGGASVLFLPTLKPCDQFRPGLDSSDGDHLNWGGSR